MKLLKLYLAILFFLAVGVLVYLNAVYLTLMLIFSVALVGVSLLILMFLVDFWME